MAEEIVMPRLSDTMAEGTISRWNKQEGDTVKRGEVILEVETDKATMDLEAYSDGVIQKIIVPAGATVAVGTAVGMLGKPGEAAAPAASSAPQASTASTPTPVAASAAAVSSTNGSGSTASTADTASAETNGLHGRVLASPLARSMAREAGIDLADLAGAGSGPRGRIVKLDVERVLAGSPAPAAPAAPASAPTAPAPSVAAVAAPPVPVADDAQVIPATRIQQVMARRMVESKTTIPHFYVTNEVDMSAAAELRRQLVGALGDEGKISYNDLIIRACALALRAMPEVNTSWQDNQFVQHPHVNIGVAVSIDKGLLVPVIRDADTKTARQIGAEMRVLAEKARAGKLSPREMESGTFSISNLGMYDVEEFQAIVNPPESAILAVGSIIDKPVVVDGQVVVRPRMKLTLSVDHRVIPGVPAAQFLQQVKKLLQEPLRLGF